MSTDQSKLAVSQKQNEYICHDINNMIENSKSADLSWCVTLPAIVPVTRFDESV